MNEEIEKRKTKNWELETNNFLLTQQLKEKEKEILRLKKEIKRLNEKEIFGKEEQMSIDGFLKDGVDLI